MSMWKRQEIQAVPRKHLGLIGSKSVKPFPALHKHPVVGKLAANFEA